MKQELKTALKPLLAVWLMAAPANALAGDAEAATLPPQQSALTVPRAESTYSVRARDFSDVPNRDARHVAAKASPRAVVILYQGSNPELMLQVVAGASDAKDGANGHDPAYVRGMIIGKHDPEFKDGKTDSFVIYVDGLPVTKPADANINPKETVKSLILWADQEYRKTGLLSLNEPTL